MFKSKNFFYILLTVCSGLISGIFSGMLGAGGGVIAVFSLSKLLPHEVSHEKDVFANTLAVILPLSLISSFFYLSGNKMNTKQLFPLLPFAVAGGIIGGLLLFRASDRALKLFFASLMILSGFFMIFF